MIPAHALYTLIEAIIAAERAEMGDESDREDWLLLDRMVTRSKLTAQQTATLARIISGEFYQDVPVEIPDGFTVTYFRTFAPTTPE